MAITRATLRLIYALRRELDQIADARTRALTAQWLRAWDQVAPELGQALHELAVAREDGRWPSKIQLARATRLQKALDLIETHLRALYRAAEQGITDDVARAATLAGRAQGDLIGSQLPPSPVRARASLTWDRVDPGAIEAIIKRATEQFTALTWPLPQAVMERIRVELIRGIAVGDNPRDVARRMLARLEAEFNGGLARALNIARTEMLDAHRAAATLAQNAASDVVDGWIWTAQLGKRTCPSCWSKHGNVYPLSQPGPWDHQSGRCTRVPHVRPWKDLGINMPEPPSILPDAETVFRSLPRAEQLQIMGPGRLAALDNGVPWSALSQLRTTPGWRDSWHTTPVRALPQPA